MPDQYLRLSELTSEIHRAINDRFAGRQFWVMADVTNHSYKADKNNHFFDLVEKDPASGGYIAKINGKAWGTGSDAIANFERITGQRFTSNISVLVCVEVQYHGQFGLQANLVQIDVNFTLGALEQQRRATLAKLVESNPGVIWQVGDRYFTRNNQLSLPRVLQRIAVVSSRTSAGAEDLKHTLEANSFGYKFVIDEYHAPVQGDQFAAEIVRQLISIYQSGKAYDIVVITRGGGSQTDFIIFDNYQLALAIARFPVPVITGIGHLRNESIADWMAHTSTKTPTKAAEFIIAHNRAFEEQVLKHQQTIIIRSQQQFAKRAGELSQAYSKVITHTNLLVNLKKDELNGVNHVVVNSSRAIVQRRHRSLVDHMSAVLARPTIMVHNQSNNLQNIAENIKTFNRQFLMRHKGYIQHHATIVNLMSPLNILKKGFAIVKAGDRIYTGKPPLKEKDKLDIVLENTRLTVTLNQQFDEHATDADL